MPGKYSNVSGGLNAGDSLDISKGVRMVSEGPVHRSWKSLGCTVCMRDITGYQFSLLTAVARSDSALDIRCFVTCLERDE